MQEKISKNQIIHIAGLAHLQLSNKEVDTLRKNLDTILKHVSNLNELDTDSLQPLGGIKTTNNVWREDTPEKSKQAGLILENAPQKKHNYFKVPKIKKS